jgi:hypothetical protein
MIPWKSFDKAEKVPPELGTSWRVNFYAMKNNGGVSWSPILGQGNFHKASRFGRIFWGEKPEAAEAKGAGGGGGAGGADAAAANGGTGGKSAPGGTPKRTALPDAPH